VFDRCSALPAVANRQSLQAPSALCVCSPGPAPLASKPHNAAHMRRLQPRPCLGARRSAHPDASGRKVISIGRYCGTRALHALPLRTPETKNPRDLRPEGVRAAREIGVADLLRVGRGQV
jgi:hypothetical protein